MTHLRPSRVLREIREGGPASCLKINITHPAVIELAGLAGASSVWLCNEHVPNDWRDVEHCVRAAKLHDMDTIVRVSKGSYSDYLKPFEADATGIMVPHVSSGDEARSIVEMCRFYPLGKRPLDGGNVDGRFCQMPAREYIEAANRERYLIFQIESPTAVENIEEIAAVGGYDFLLFGPGDYAHQIGQVGDVRHPEVLAAREKVETAARKYGRRLFSVAAGGSAREQWERGYAIINSGSDVWSLGEAFRANLESACPAPAASLYARDESHV